MALGLTRYEAQTVDARPGHPVTVTLVEADGFASAECDGCGWYISGDPDGSSLAELVTAGVHCHRIGVDTER